MPSEDDDDFAKAIALSLQETSRKPETIDSDEDDDTQFQDELRKALEASRETSRPECALEATPPPVEALNGFLSERAKLERERLERQKRLRPHSISTIPTEEDSEDDDEPPAKRQNISSSATTSRSSVSGSAAKVDIPTIEQVFWNGELRQTATKNADPRKDGASTFRITEILGKMSDLSFAILSSYSLDYSWIYQFFEPSIPVIMVAQPDASGEASIKNVLPHWVRTTPFLRAGFGCQHMKFMLLFYKNGRLRVVISTANLIAYDWRDMENVRVPIRFSRAQMICSQSVWLQDIPLRRKPIPHDPKADDFPGMLQKMLRGINIRPALAAMISDNHPDLPLKSIDQLRQNWDWSDVKAHLVASLAGKHEGWPCVIQTGHPRLMTIVRKIGMKTGQAKGAKDVVLECQGSSLGTYTTQWLNEFHWSARGESAEDWLDKARKFREKLPYPSVKIVFPSKATVQNSAAGEIGGGTIFCRRKQWTAKNFPRSHFYDSKSKGGPVLMHSKMIIAMLRGNPLAKRKKDEPSDTEDDDDDIEVIEPAAGWAYIGSHNFTPSAWGTLSGSSFQPVLNISNYEVGVVILLKDENTANKIACFQRPPRKYKRDDDPWIQEESAHHQNQR
ncbi:tyrosyl-DNA phosphodiesterase-domain-containing protein [Crepidotus variabilis]|uniref:Tyrosyl-DNA phosphodiesterase-domain-containing protein n=1 Tax=Crepidotus variabilis TaxID=179855 RepID=A0A9P6JRI0_9AGAR|nr:tyrosyl-DNA phosphodiesterase-domain-containing protein [Crepidotus variabilis]